MAFDEIERVRVLFLDKRNCLIADELVSSGTVDQAPFYAREVLKLALELSAMALIIAHNHPSGSELPSSADVASTRDLSAAAAQLGITVHDHYVVGRFGVSSMRGLGLF